MNAPCRLWPIAGARQPHWIRNCITVDAHMLIISLLFKDLNDAEFLTAFLPIPCGYQIKNTDHKNTDAILTFNITEKIILNLNFDRLLI